MVLTREEIIRLLQDETNQKNLFKKADDIRRQYVGDEVHLRGLIEFSNICRNNCMYCGIRKGRLGFHPVAFRGAKALSRPRIRT